MVYTYMRRESIGRGLNLNAPVDGVRPDPRFGNIIEAVSDASARQHTIGFNYQIGALPPPVLPPNAPRIDWKRVFLIGQYTYGIWNNNFEGQFSPPPSGTLATEWGRTSSDARHRLNFTLVIADPEEPAGPSRPEHGQRAAVHDPDRERRQRRSHLQRSPGWRGTEHRTRRLRSGR